MSPVYKVKPVLKGVVFDPNIKYSICIKNNIVYVDNRALRDYSKAFCSKFAQHLHYKGIGSKQDIEDGILDVLSMFYLMDHKAGLQIKTPSSSEKVQGLSTNSVPNSFSMEHLFGASTSSLGISSNYPSHDVNAKLDHACAHVDTSLGEDVDCGGSCGSDLTSSAGSLDDDCRSITDQFNRHKGKPDKVMDDDDCSSNLDKVVPEVTDSPFAKAKESTAPVKQCDNSWVVDGNCDEVPIIEAPPTKSVQLPLFPQIPEIEKYPKTPEIEKQEQTSPFTLTKCKHALTVTSPPKQTKPVTPFHELSTPIKSVNQSCLPPHSTLQTFAVLSRHHDQSMSDFLPCIPPTFKPLWGRLYNENYKNCNLGDHFVIHPSVDGGPELYHLKQAGEVSPLGPQIQSGIPQSENGLLSLHHDDFTIDRFYYFLHCPNAPSTLRQDRFWDIVVLHKKQVNDLTELRKQSILTCLNMKDGKLSQLQSKLQPYVNEPKDCPMHLMVQVYTFIYHYPVLVLKGSGNLLTEERFCVKYWCIAKSKNIVLEHCPYIILIHTRQAKGGGNVSQKADLYLPNPNLYPTKAKPLVVGMERCYPVDNLGNYMPYFEYKWYSDNNNDSWSKLLSFERAAPFIKLKSFLDEYTRFHVDSQLKISYSMERAILQALLPWDLGASKETQTKLWTRLCVDFYKQMCKVHHEIWGYSRQVSLNYQDLADPVSESLIIAKIHCYARMCNRVIYLCDILEDNSLHTIISQEPASSVKVDWPHLFIGRTRTSQEPSFSYRYHPGCISRSAMGKISKRHDVLFTPYILDSDAHFKDMPAMCTQQSVQCNFDAITIISPNIKHFGSTFLDKSQTQQGVCITAPFVHLKRNLSTKDPVSKDRFKLNIYTKTRLNQGTQYSFFPELDRGLVHLRKVSLTNFPTLSWGHICIGSYKFNVNVTILDFGNYQKGEFSNYKKLSKLQQGVRWKTDQLMSFTKILQLAEKMYSASMDNLHTSVNKEYQADWTCDQHGPTQNIYTKMNGFGFSSLCDGIYTTCLDIIHGKIYVDQKTLSFAKKLIKFSLFSATTPGSKISNQLGNYNPASGADGEDLLMLNGYKLFKTLTGTVFSAIIPDPMAGCIIGLDLGYNTIEATLQHSLFVLNEHGVEVVKENLYQNTEIAKSWKSHQNQGNLHDLWNHFSSCGTDIVSQFWKFIQNLEVCIIPKGYIHACLTMVYKDREEVGVQFYSLNSNVLGSIHIFKLKDIRLAEVPAAADQLDCICFNIHTQAISHVKVSSSLPDQCIDSVLHLRFSNHNDILFQEGHHIICPVWISSNYNNQIDMHKQPHKTKMAPTSTSTNGLPQETDTQDIKNRKSNQKSPDQKGKGVIDYIHPTRKMASSTTYINVLPPETDTQDIKNMNSNQKLLVQEGKCAPDNIHPMVILEDNILFPKQVHDHSYPIKPSGRLEQKQNLLVNSLASCNIDSQKQSLPKRDSKTVPLKKTNYSPTTFVGTPAMAITNYRNFCYAISTTQMLLCCNCLCDAALKYSPEKDLPNENPVQNANALQIFVFVVRKLIEEHSKWNKPTIIQVTDCFRNINFNAVYDTEKPDDQQDALEFCQQLLEKLNESTPEIKTLSKYSVQISMYCEKCLISELLIIDNLNLIFAIKVGPSGFSGTQEALDFYFMSGDHLVAAHPQCRQCEKKTIGTHFCLRGTQPTYICIHYDRITEQNSKYQCRISVCHYINITMKKKVTRYRLKAMVCHIGDSPSSGHYVTYGYRVTEEGHQWCKFNQNQVHVIGSWDHLNKVNSDDLNTRNFTRKNKWHNTGDYRKQVVMLLYEEVETKAPPTSLLGGGLPQVPPSTGTHITKNTSSPHTKNTSSPLKNIVNDDRMALDNYNYYNTEAHNFCEPAFNENLHEDTTDSDSDYIDNGSSSDDDSDWFEGSPNVFNGNKHASLRDSPRIYDEMHWLDCYYQMDNFSAPTEIAFPPQSIHKYGQFGNKRTCGFGSSYYSLQLNIKKSDDTHVGAAIDIIGPPNGVASMCVYSSQGKTAEVQLKQAKKEAHQVPYLLDKLFNHALLKDGEFIMYLDLLVKNMTLIQGCRQLSKSGYHQPSSIRVEYNISINPQNPMPNSFLPLSSSSICKAIAGTEMQNLFMDRIDIHALPLDILKGNIHCDLEEIKSIVKVKNYNPLVVNNVLTGLRQKLSNITPNLQASYIQSAAMVMGYIGGKYGSYQPDILKDVMEDHPYEIKICSSCCTEKISVQAQNLGFSYVVKESALFPDHINPNMELSNASKVLQSCWIQLYSKKHTNSSKKEYGNLLDTPINHGPKHRNETFYQQTENKIKLLWKSFFEKHEKKSISNNIAHVCSTEQRLADLLTSLSGNDHVLQSFGLHLKALFTVIIKSYYLDLEYHLHKNNGDGTQFVGISNIFSLSDLKQFVRDTQKEVTTMLHFHNQISLKKFVVVSAGNDHAKTELQAFHNHKHHGHNYLIGTSKNELLFHMFNLSMDSVQVQYDWALRFPSITLCLSLVQTLNSVRGILNSPVSQILQVSKLEAIFHKVFFESKYQYIWYRPKKLNAKYIILIDAQCVIVDDFESVTEVEILQGSCNLGSLHNTTKEKVMFCGYDLAVPLPTSLLQNNIRKERFSKYVGKHHIGDQEVSTFEIFLLACMDSISLFCTNCSKEACKCSSWTKVVHQQTKFQLSELRSGQKTTLNAFVTRIKQTMPQWKSMVQPFNPAPFLSAIRKWDEQLQSEGKFRGTIVAGLSPKIVMAWRALRICYIQELKITVDPTLSDSTMSEIVAALFPPSISVERNLPTSFQISPLKRPCPPKFNSGNQIKRIRLHKTSPNSGV